MKKLSVGSNIPAVPRQGRKHRQPAAKRKNKTGRSEVGLRPARTGFLVALKPVVMGSQSTAMPVLPPCFSVKETWLHATAGKARTGTTDSALRMVAGSSWEERITKQLTFCVI